MKKIYFDYASTTPVDPEVIRAMEPYWGEKFGNAASPHAFGQQARKALEDARQTLADFIAAKSEEIIFNSGGTEGNNHAIFGIAQRLKNRGKHIIICAIEHHSVIEPVRRLGQEGYKITCLQVDRDGLVDPEDVQMAVTDQTILIAVMHANNEIGTIQPVAQIGRIAKNRDVPFLVDAVQTVGHIPVNVGELGADVLSLSAHKFYGPKGVGALYVRQGTEILPFLLGGAQERGQRASTPNVAGAVGLARAVELCRERMEEEGRQQTRWRNRLLEEVPRIIDGVKINGHRTKRLPNNAHFAFECLEAESLLMSLDRTGIAASMGSACAAGAMEPSHVLKAIGLSDELAHGALRISLGRWTTQEQIDYFLEQLPQIVPSLRV